MHRSERGAGASAEIAAARNGNAAAALRDRVRRPGERDPRKPEIAGRSGGGDVRGAKFAARTGVLARRVLRPEEAVTNLRQ